MCDITLIQNNTVEVLERRHWLVEQGEEAVGERKETYILATLQAQGEVFEG